MDREVFRIIDFQKITNIYDSANVSGSECIIRAGKQNRLTSSNLRFEKTVAKGCFSMFNKSSVLLSVDKCIATFGKINDSKYLSVHCTSD